MKGTIMTGLSAKRHVDINRTRPNHQSAFAFNNNAADGSNKKTPHIQDGGVLYIAQKETIQNF